MADPLPTVDDLLGVPNADEILKGAMRARQQQGIDYAAGISGMGGGAIPPGVAYDPQFSSGSLGRIMSSFGQGLRQGWGADAIGMSPETEEGLRKLGVFSDMQKRQGGVFRTFNESFIRSSAYALDAALRASAAGLSGVAAAGGQSIRELGGSPALQRDVSALINLEPFYGMLPLGFRAMFGMPRVAQAERMGVIGQTAPEGYFGLSTEPRSFFNTANIPPEQWNTWRATIDDQKTMAAERPMAIGPTDLPSRMEEVQPVAPSAVGYGYEGYPLTMEAEGIGADLQSPIYARTRPYDINDFVRERHPQLFTEYDALDRQRQLIRDRLRVAQDERQTALEREAPHTDAISALEDRMQDATPRLQKKYETRLEQMRAERESWLADEQNRSRILADTEDMARDRRLFLETDAQMRDMAPTIATAYRDAAGRFPEPMVQPGATLTPVPAAPLQNVAMPRAEPLERPSPQAPQPPQSPPIDVIQDVAGKMIAAGRSAEEAQAGAALWGAYYDAKAARFQGALGTGAEIYQREAPDIQRGRGGVRGNTTISDSQRVIRLMGRADASTFIHETGHNWLNDLLTDAQRTEAPDQLRQDAATVRNWLGAEGELTRAQHERFARGFERYMMEGVAPNSGLARVFEQFKQWLSSIYDSVKGLRVNMTDDIRKVFDRMLGEEAQPTVIAPEGRAEPPLPSPLEATREPSVRVTETMARLHETDAAETTPSEAPQVADAVRAEIDKTIREHAPEVADELGRRTAEAGRDEIEARRAEGNEPGRSTSEADSREPGALNPGGDRVATEGSAVHTPEGTVTTVTPKTTTEAFAPSDGPIVDKAGNIRLDLLNWPDDLKQYLKEMAERNNDFQDKRRGVVSHEQTFALADALGMAPNDVVGRKIGSTYNAHELKYLADLLKQAATGFKDASATFERTQSAADYAAFLEAEKRLQMIQGQLSGGTAEIARALNIIRVYGRDIKDVKSLTDMLHEETGTTFNQALRRAKAVANAETVGQVNKMARDADAGWYKKGILMAQEVYINNLISGPITHVTYGIANLALATYRAAESGLAGGIGTLRNALGNTGERVYAGEAGARIWGIANGIPNGIVSGWKALKSGMAEPLPGESAATARAAMIGFVQGEIPNPTVGGVTIPLGTAVRLPQHGVAAIHSLSRSIEYNAKLNELAWRQASAEGLQGNQFYGRIAELIQAPTEAMMDEASASATIGAMMGQGGKFTQMLTGLVNSDILGAPHLKFLVPFVRVGSNIGSEALLERSPLGVFDPAIRANLRGENGRIAQDTQIARLALGTAFGATIGAMTLNGFVNGSGPLDPHEKAIWMAAGNQPNSIRIGNTWYSMSRMGPVGVMFKVAANAAEIYQRIQEGRTERLGAAVIVGISHAILDEGWMRGAADAIEAVHDTTGHAGAKWVRNFVSNLAVPYSIGMGQVARAVDPYVREVNSIHDAVMSKIPFLSKDLWPRRDIFGSPIPNRESAIVPGTNAIYASAVNNDPVIQKLLQLGVFPAAPKKEIMGVKLDEAQHDTYAQVHGQMLRELLVGLTQTPGFDVVPRGIQTEEVIRVQQAAGKFSHNMMMMRYPDLLEQALRHKEELLTIGRTPK